MSSSWHLPWFSELSLSSPSLLMVFLKMPWALSKDPRGNQNAQACSRSGGANLQCHLLRRLRKEDLKFKVSLGNLGAQVLCKNKCS